jgi:branched-chain amino acid aminotransferase
LSWVYLDGELLLEDQAGIPVTAASALTGRGVFETFRARPGERPFQLDRHMARMASGARLLGIAPAPTTEEIEEASQVLVGRCGLDDARVRVTLLARTASGDRYDRCLIIQAAPLVYAEQRYTEGVAAIVSSIRRDEGSPLSRIKSVSRLESALAGDQARGAGVFDSLLLNHAGRVAEGSITNVFAVTGGVLVTPPVSEGALPGITREAVLELSRGAGMLANERPLENGELLGAEEVFLTNAVRGILPLVRVGDETIGGGVPGPVTRRLRVMLKDAASGDEG